MTLPLLDTCLVLQYTRASSPVIDRVEADYGRGASPFRPSVSVVTVGESRAFAYGFGESRRALLRTLVAGLTIIDVSREEVLDAYGWLHDAVKHSPYTIGQNDLWIAACARASGATLMTSEEDFLRLPPGCIKLVQVDAGTGVTRTTWDQARGGGASPAARPRRLDAPRRVERRERG